MCDYRMGRHKAVLALFDQPQRLAIAAGCIWNIHDTAKKILRASSSDAIQFFDAAMGLIRPAGDVAAISPTEAKSLLESTSKWLPETGVGVFDASMCVIMILQRAGSALTGSDVYEILSYAYQVVLYSEILSKLERDVTEDEVREMEAANPNCIACINEQIQLIANGADGGAR